MKAKDMLTDRHWHRQTPTHEKLSSLPSLLVCNLTRQWAQLALGRCWEELVVRGGCRDSTKRLRCTWSLRSRCLAGGQQLLGTRPVQDSAVRIPLSAERGTQHPSWQFCNGTRIFTPKTWYLTLEVDHYFQHAKLRIFHCAQKINLPVACSISDHPAGLFG